MSTTSSAPSSPRGAGFVRWGAAVSTARTLASGGPRLTTSEAIPIVESIREAADASVAHVHRLTGLEAAQDLRDSEVLVVDRAGWATGAVGGFRQMLQPALDAALGDKFQGNLPLSLRLGGYGVGAEMGALVAFLASHVLGQYDPFSSTPEAPGGRLLLVAPNIVQVERELNVDTADFRLWVTLHEQTHRVQFAAAPWLREHLSALIGQLAGGLLAVPGSLRERVKGVTADTRGAVEASGDRADDAGSAAGLLSVLGGEEEKRALSEITAVMSVLEGHANVIMDGVDASVIPTVKTIRQRFEKRGADRSALQKLVFRVLGLAAKGRQYRDGQAFVQAAVDELGMAGFNRIWDGPAHLPSEAELHDPAAWIARMKATP